MKLGLGTVQFGIDYGISNTSGKTAEEEVARILAVAMRHGIGIIDTAAQYGTSEEVLGRTFPERHDFQIVTKTPRFSVDRITVTEVHNLEETINRSLRNLGVSSLYGLMFHHADDLLTGGSELLWQKIGELKHQGLVRKIGVSVYNARQIDAILDRFSIEIIQLPVNVLDQRLLLSGHIAKLKTAGVKIHTRSAFLQGLLLMDPDRLPPHFDTIKAHLMRYHERLRYHGMTPVQAALGFVTGLDEVDTVICGVNNHQQLEELCVAATSFHAMDFQDYAITDESILNPSRWPAHA